MLPTQGTGADRNKEKIHHESGYRRVIEACQDDQKTMVRKSERHGLAQEGPQVPQGCPLGPKFWVKIFSHTNPGGCVQRNIFGLLVRNWSLFSGSGQL